MNRPHICHMDNKPGNIIVGLTAGVLSLILLWGGALFFAIKEAKVSCPVAVTVRGPSGDQQEKIEVSRITPRSYRLEPLERSALGTWSTSKYCSGIVVTFPDDVLSILDQIEVRIGENSFRFTKESFTARWKRIKSESGRQSFEAPESVKCERGLSFVPQFNGLINWPGDAAAAVKSFRPVYAVLAVCAGFLMFLCLKYSDRLRASRIFGTLMRNKRIKIIAIVITSLLMGFYLFGGSMKGTFSIDLDHQIINFLGEDGRLSLNEIPHILYSPECDNTANFRYPTRFIPSYSILRMVETLLWGGSAVLWYFVRILIFSFFVMVLWYFLESKIGFIYAFIFTVAVISYEYWARIFAHIGFNEVYGVLGVGLYFLGFCRYLKKVSLNVPRSERLSVEWALMIAGSLIAIGSKENLILLLNIPVIYLLAYSIAKRRFSISVLVNSLGMIAFSFFVFLVVYLKMTKLGHDAYDRDVSILARSAFLKGALLSKESLAMLASIAVLISGFAGIWLVKGSGYIRNNLFMLGKILLGPVFLIGSFYVVYLSQVVVYSNTSWPGGLRYDFPVMLALNLFYLVLILTALNLVKFLKASDKTVAAIKAFLFLAFILLIARNYSSFDVRQYVRRNAEDTNLFKKYMERMAAECQKNPDDPIILESFHVRDYEPIWSLTRYRTFYKIRNPLYLEVNGYSPERESTAFDKKGAGELLNVSKNGGWGIRPLSELSVSDDKCYVVEFSGHSDRYASCKNMGKIFQAWVELEKIPEPK